MKPLSQSGRPRASGRRKRLTEMNANELAAATAQFDRENLSPPTPLRGEKLRRFRRAISRRGRPRIGKGSKAITVTLERGLLTRADRVARERHITRSQLIASALMAHFHAGDANE